MNGNWIFIIAILIALVMVPRFIAEIAWGRRVQVKAKAKGSGRLSLRERLRAQSLPWLLFGIVGAGLAILALVALFASR